MLIIPPAFGASDLVMVDRVNIDIAPLPVFTGLPFHSNITGSYTIIPPALSPGVYCSPGPVKYRPAFIEIISTDKSE